MVAGEGLTQKHFKSFGKMELKNKLIFYTKHF